MKPLPKKRHEEFLKMRAPEHPSTVEKVAVQLKHLLGDQQFKHLLGDQRLKHILGDQQFKQSPGGPAAQAYSRGPAVQTSHERPAATTLRTRNHFYSNKIIYQTKSRNRA